MDRRFQERLIGAVVLVGAAVLILPAVLSGPGMAVREPPAEDAGEPALRTQTIQLDAPAGPAPLPLAHASAEHAPAPSDSASVADPEPTTAVQTPPAAPALPTVNDAVPLPVRTPAAQADPAEVRGAGSATGWAVQVGNFSSQVNAEALAARLEVEGYAAFVMPRVAGQRTTYRVRVGPEADVEAARAIERRLEAAGHPADIVRHP